MMPVQARLMEVARSIRQGSNARLIVLRATEGAIANLLKPGPTQKTIAPRPSVLPARPTPPGMPGVALAREAERLLAGQPTTLVTQAYVEAGARAPTPVNAETLRDGAAPLPVPATVQQGAPVQGIDPRAMAFPAPSPAQSDDEQEWRPARRAEGKAGGAGQDGHGANVAAGTDQLAVLAVAGGLLAFLALALIWVLAG